MDIFNEKANNKNAFYDYQLSTSARLIKTVIAIIALFNIGLMIPDSMNLIHPAERLLAIMVRSVFVLMAIWLFIWMKKIKTFKMLSAVITGFELISVFVFLYIFFLYDTPDFVIQLLGVMIIILVVSMIPNLWLNKLIVTIIIAISFFACSAFIFKDINQMRFAAGLVYMAIEVVLCAIFSYYYYRNQYREYVAKIELQRIYATDPLTQVGNRVKLDDEAKRWIAFCNRYNVPLSIVVIDIDNMKQINDQYGHLVGDVILYEVAQIMHTQLRKNDVCTRWGGDEFILLLPHTNIDQAISLTKRIQQAISVHQFNIDIDITCSYGIAGLKKGLNMEQLIRQADESMYMAKKQGKNIIKSKNTKEDQ